MGINIERCAFCDKEFGICGAVHISSDGNKYHLTCPTLKKESDMSVLDDYLNELDSVEQILLKDQWREVVEKHTVHCLCGQIRAVEHTFRCLYCGFWYCTSCAEKHFGETIREHIAKRQSLESTTADDYNSSAPSKGTVSLRG